MAKPKYKVPSLRVRLDGNLRMAVPWKDVDPAEWKTLDPREQKFLDWYLAHRDDRKAFGVMKDLMVAILNGEVGPVVQAAVVDGNTNEAIDALQDLVGGWGGDEVEEEDITEFIIPTPDPAPLPSASPQMQDRHLEGEERAGI
jgi:hypothetical protein